MDGFSWLGLGNYTSLMVDIDIKNWGRTVLVDCVYDPQTRLPYRIVFENCEEVKWFFDQDQIDCIDLDHILDIVDFQIKQKFNKNQALFYTHILELSIICQTLAIEKDW